MGTDVDYLHGEVIMHACNMQHESREYTCTSKHLPTHSIIYRVVRSFRVRKISTFIHFEANIFKNHILLMSMPTYKTSLYIFQNFNF